MVTIETTIGMLLHVSLLSLGEEDDTYKALCDMFDDAFMERQRSNLIAVTFAWNGIVVSWNDSKSSCTYTCEKAKSAAMAMLVVALSF